MQRITSVCLFLLVAHQAFSQFNTIEFQKEQPLVNVILKMGTPTKAISFDSRVLPQLIQLTKRGNAVLLASAPLDDFSVISKFGFRSDPISGEHKFHRGIDLKTNRSKVYSMLHGKVVSVGKDPILGNFVKVKHGKYESLYGHLSQVLVSPDENVLPGSVLGVSGNTGRATGDHLHLTIKKGKEYLNPALFIQIIAKLSTKEELITYLSNH